VEPADIVTGGADSPPDTQLATNARQSRMAAPGDPLLLTSPSIASGSRPPTRAADGAGRRSIWPAGRTGVLSRAAARFREFGTTGDRWTCQKGEGRPGLPFGLCER